MIKSSQKEVRNVKFHVKITDADMLGQAIKDIVSRRTSGSIDVNGRGFKIPDMDSSKATIYSSSVIMADQKDAPSGNYIYTMENVTFSTEMKSNSEGKLKPQEVDLKLNGGWVLKDGEYALVVFTNDNAAADMQKLQGRLLYNAVFTRYVTQAIGEDVLELRGFSARTTDGDYPDLKKLFNSNKPATDLFRGGKSKGAGPFADDGPKEQKKENSRTPKFVKDNYFLYDPKFADVSFGYKDPASKTPFNKETDPGISFSFHFSDFSTDGDPVRVDGIQNPIFLNSNDPNPGDVEIKFNNIPKNMPYEIFDNIYNYIKDGLGGKELSAGTNATHGNAIYTQSPESKGTTLFEVNKKRISEMKKEIADLYKENTEYLVDFDTNYPNENSAKGVKKNQIKYLNELESYVEKLKNNLPMSLEDLDRLIEEKGTGAVKPKQVNLLKLLK